jgi:hypothetical protein
MRWTYSAGLRAPFIKSMGSYRSSAMTLGHTSMGGRGSDCLDISSELRPGTVPPRPVAIMHKTKIGAYAHCANPLMNVRMFDSPVFVKNGALIQESGPKVVGGRSTIRPFGPANAPLKAAILDRRQKTRSSALRYQQTSWRRLPHSPHG